MAEDSVMDKVLRGVCPFKELPPIIKKVVRIFVSSTFSDTKEERNALMRDVYPKLADLCREKFGLEFQVVDMRWGVPEHASDNHSTTELCLEEIKKCQEVSVGPNFVVLLGHKYGYRPIPNIITEKEFLALIEVVPDEDAKNWSVVEKWYLNDANCVPSVYVLQPISSILKDYNNKDDSELRKKAQSEWWNTENILTDCLRKFSTAAHKNGKLSSEEKHKFFMSVTENEVSNGILHSKSDPKESCIAVIRNIPDIENNLDHIQAPRFIDTLSKEAKLDLEANNFLKQLRDQKLKEKVPDNNIAHVTIEWNTSGANISVENAEFLKVAEFAQKMLPDKEMKVVKHKEYLDGLCREFYEKTSKMIKQGGVKSSKAYDPVITEVLQHSHFARGRCEVFEGREDILDTAKDYLSNDSRSPLVVYGNSGCGKTTIMARLYEMISDGTILKCIPTENESCKETPQTTENNGDNESQPKMRGLPIIRFLGTTPHTSTIQQVLTMICKQISRINNTPWEEPDKYSALVKSFLETLKLATQEQPIILLIDSVDQLLPAYNAYKMGWLPTVLPDHVKVIISTIEEGYAIHGAMKEKYEDKGGTFVEVKPLGENVGMTIIQRWLKLSNRTINAEQSEIVKKALNICSLPLYARIAFDQIRKWKSFDTPTIEELKPTIQAAITKHFESMETKFGAPLVKHCLSYLTASRFGLSEMELEHLLSLDDDLLGQIYKFWRPPVRRIPPLLWTRVRNEISSYVVERSADGILVLAWYHRQFTSATKARYLADQAFSAYIHTILAEYFLGLYGGGVAKPFKYTEHQKTRFKLDTVDSAEDRKVPSQPYYMESKSAGEVTVRYNERKLSELPLHLLKSKQHDLLRKEVFFNYEWLYAKLKATSARALLQEFELFMSADKVLRKDPELKLLFANLQLIRPYIAIYPDSLPAELTGRLARNIGLYQSITNLIKQCDRLGPKHCPLTPALTMYQTADIGLKQNINFRDTDIWHEGGAMTCTKDFKTLYLVDYDIQGFSYLSTWDIPSGERVSERTIQKTREEDVTDIYIDLYLDHTETLLIGVFKMKYYNRLNCETGAHRFTGNGHLEVIKIDDCTILYSFNERTHKQDFYNCHGFIRNNWLSFRFGWHLPVINFRGEKEKIQFSNPNMLTHDEKYFITICGRKVGVKMYQGDEKVVGKVRTKCATIKEFATKENEAEFDKTDRMKAIEIAKDNKTVFLGDGDGNINIYEIERVSEGKLFKVKKTLSLSRNHKLEVTDTIQEMRGEENAHVDYRVKLILSPKEDSIICVYQTCYDTQWEAVLWNIPTGKDLGHIAKDKPTTCKYPTFNHDGSMIIMYDPKLVQMISASTGEQVKVYDVGQEIRDLSVSKTTPQMAIMLGKDIMFLDASAVDTPVVGGKRKRKGRKVPVPGQGKGEAVSAETTLLPLELITNTDVNPEIIASKVPGKSEVQISEKEGIIESVDLGGLSSARSQLNVPLDTWETPDGTKVIQLRSKVQVIDSKEDEIKYTPRTGDVIMRAVQQGDQGQQKTDTLEIPNLAGSISANPVVELLDGDRIVGEGNKTRLRVTSSSTKGRMKIMTVPSVVSVGVLHESGEKIKRLRRITVYQESIAAVSNRFLVTHKKKAAGEYINIYYIDEGKLLATHQVTGALGCVRLSADQSRLFMATKDRSLKVFTGQMFLTNECKIDASQVPSNQKYTIRDILTFPLNPDAVIMKYSEEGVAGMGMNCYIHINLSSKEKSPPTVVKPILEDIAKDGSIAIDNQLNLYNMPQGQIYKKLPYANAGVNMQLQARISDDKKHVVLLDVNDDTLHLIKFVGQSAKTIGSCFTHASDLSTMNGFSLRQSGKCILIRGPILGLLVIRDPIENVKDKNKIKYQSENQRLTSLLEASKGDVSNLQVSASRQTSVSSVATMSPLTPTTSSKTAGKAVIQDFITSLTS